MGTSNREFNSEGLPFNEQASHQREAEILQVASCYNVE